MSNLPRFREPMCGWPHDVDLCEHEIPRSVCGDCAYAGIAEAKAVAARLRRHES